VRRYEASRHILKSGITNIVILAPEELKKRLRIPLMIAVMVLILS
jgi:hypothetical protein